MGRRFDLRIGRKGDRDCVLGIAVYGYALDSSGTICCAWLWQRIRGQFWNFAIGSRTMRRAGTILSDCGGRRGSAARNVGRRIIGVTARGLRHCRGCGRQTSVTAGTLFADTHLPLRLWVEALWHVTSQKSGTSALGLQRVLGLGSYHTAWNLLHKLRRAMVRPGRERLQGIIEVDEIFIGGPRPGKRGRGAQGKVLVVVAAQQAAKGIGRIRLTRVADASARSL